MLNRNYPLLWKYWAYNVNNLSTSKLTVYVYILSINDGICKNLHVMSKYINVGQIL